MALGVREPRSFHLLPLPSRSLPPALLALAAHAMHEGYRASPCLVYASSDHADRAAALLARAA